MAKRIVMTRQRPWRKDNPEAVIVDRTTKWGNPYKVVRVGDSWTIEDGEIRPFSLSKEEATRIVVEWFAEAVANGWDGVPFRDEIRSELGGKNLACWCPLDQPCHADVLLEIANGADDACS